jgi:ATP-dependent phosphofructokinase / diphosphate-dependent phosphofructokinase
MKKHIVIGQAGGPTSVMNASLIGLIEKVYKDHKLTFSVGGYEGLAYANFIDDSIKNIEKIKQYKQVPGSCLTSGRFKIEDSTIVSACQNLKKIGADVLVMIGGNGSMKALQLIGCYAKTFNLDLQTIGIPKTVDNDLAGTDHAPGFGSAVRYVAQSVKDIGYDLASMQNFEQVRIIETMGRNAGWLTAGAGLYKQYGFEAPHTILLPETQVDSRQVLDEIKKTIELYGYSIVVVSEGVNWEHNQYRQIVNGREVLGGVARNIVKTIQNNLQVHARAEILGMNQRSSSIFVSDQDFYEAEHAGKYAGILINEGRTEEMVTIERLSTAPYHVKMGGISLTTVANGGEKVMPKEFIKNRDKYYKWLSPLVGPENYLSPPSLFRKEEKYASSFHQS